MKLRGDAGESQFSRGMRGHLTRARREVNGQTVLNVAATAEQHLFRAVHHEVVFRNTSRRFSQELHSVQFLAWPDDTHINLDELQQETA